MSYLNTTIVHVSEDEFKKSPASFLQKVEIKGDIIQVYNEDGSYAFVVPEWFMRAFVRDKIGLKPEEPKQS